MGFNFKIQTPWLKDAGKPQPAKSFYSARELLHNRAFRYVCARYGLRETTFDEGSCSWPRRGVHFFETRVDRETRVQAVLIGDVSYLIPHWDFVAEITEMQGAFA